MVKVRDGRKYPVGEVATLKHATNTVTGRVISNTPTPKLTAPNAATIVLDASVSNNNDAAATPAAPAPAASAPAPAASPQRSQAALAAERRAAGLASSPLSSESSGSPTVVSTSSETSSGSTGSLVTMAPSPAPAPLGPMPLQEAPTLGVPMSGVRCMCVCVCVCVCVCGQYADAGVAAAGVTQDPRIEQLMAIGATEVRAATAMPPRACSLACERFSLTQCGQEQASTALEAADGDVERAANMILMV